MLRRDPDDGKIASSRREPDAALTLAGGQAAYTGVVCPGE
jgi:hypothetical protein